MSLIAIQVENFSTRNFPLNDADTNSKLNVSFLDYLDFSDSPMEKDDFIRVVIQFTDENNSDSEALKFKWCIIPNTTAFVEPFQSARWSQRTRSGQNRIPKCKVLWLRGLECFKPLFFDNENILKNLEIILSGNRDFLKAVDFPEVQLPTVLQTSLEGLRFMANQARHLSRPENVYINDRSFRDEEHFKNHLKSFGRLQLPIYAYEHRNNSSIITGDVAIPDPIPPHDQEYIDRICAENLAAVKNLNSNYTTKIDNRNAINNLILRQSGDVARRLVDSEWGWVSGNVESNEETSVSVPSEPSVQEIRRKRTRTSGEEK